MLVSRQPSLTSVRRDAWVEVDLAAVEKNVRVVRSWLTPGTQLMAVVKSDGYGHGAASLAPVLQASGAQWFGVASVDEGCQLRDAGVKIPILILSPCPSWAMSTAIDSGLQITITASSQVADLVTAATRLQKQAQIHLKVDTGMHRLGVSPMAVADVLAEIDCQKSLKLVGIFSHLAQADEEATTQRQNCCFQDVLKRISRSGKPAPLIHLSSGEAARRFPDTHYDLVRVGLYLYGLEPQAVSQVVTPALSLRGRITHLQGIEAGQSVGYGLTWAAERPTRLASIPIGYADGVDRGLSNRLLGLFMGKAVKQVGLISMDQMLFDVTDVPQANEGDVITLIGTEGPAVHREREASQNVAAAGASTLHLATWATMLDTITYELACRLRVRLPRIYTRPRPSAGLTGKTT